MPLPTWGWGCGCICGLPCRGCEATRSPDAMKKKRKKKVADPTPYDEMRYGGRRSVMHACMRYSLQLLKAGGWRWFQTVLHVYLLFLDAIP